MAWLILILVLLAAAFGVLGAVVKAVAFLVLTILLTVAALAAIAWYGFKHQIRRWEQGADMDRARTRGRTGDARDLPSHDDRY
jgi:peptidoglycan/LPS O-acetylase OafA/YrhL